MNLRTPHGLVVGSPAEIAELLHRMADAAPSKSPAEPAPARPAAPLSPFVPDLGGAYVYAAPFPRDRMSSVRAACPHCGQQWDIMATSLDGRLDAMTVRMIGTRCPSCGEPIDDPVAIATNPETTG